jgi:hypothetical protein
MALNNDSHLKKSKPTGPNTTGSNYYRVLTRLLRTGRFQRNPRSGRQTRRPSAQMATVIALFILFIRYAKPGHRCKKNHAAHPARKLCAESAAFIEDSAHPGYAVLPLLVPERLLCGRVAALKVL